MITLNYWRLVHLNELDGYKQMAIDEAMLILRAENKIPNTLRFFVFKPSTITIGYFQSMIDEVNLDFCKRRGISVVRRITGGGAVFHDTNGEITYSIVVSEKEAPKDIIKSYELYCRGLVIALKKLGLNAEFKPVNDVLVYGKKISGSAQTRKRGVVLQHGTFMYDTDIGTLAVALRIVPEKLRDKGASKLEERVITVSKALGRRVCRSEALQALIEGFKEALKVKFVEDKLTQEELELAKKLVKEKYSRNEWNLMV